MMLEDRPLTLALSTAESLPSTALLEQPAAAAMKAELQVLLAEVKRLGLHQEHLKQEVNDMESCNAEAAVARPHKSANLRLNGCIMTECPGPVLTVPFGRQWEAGSSDWSEAAAETPVRNLISGGYTGFNVARDLLRMDLTPAKEEDSDTDSVKAEIEAPAALPPALGLTPDQLRKARRHRRKYGLAQPRPNSPKPKKLSPQKNSRFGITINRAREILGMTTSHMAEAQKKSLHKLTTQKSHSFTAGATPTVNQCVARRFDDIYTTASPAAKQYVAKRFDDVMNGDQSPKLLAQKLANPPASMAPAKLTNVTVDSPYVSSGLHELSDYRSSEKTCVAHATYSGAKQQVLEQVETSHTRTYIRTELAHEAGASAAQGMADPFKDTPAAQINESAQLSVKESCGRTPAISQQVRKEYEALVAEDRQPAAASAACNPSADRGLEGMEAKDLLALLARLGAQQQAVLSAIAAKQQPFQWAAADRQHEPAAFQSGSSSPAPKGHGINISVAAGDAALQAQLQHDG